MKNIHSKINEKLGKMILPQPIGSLADLTEKNLQKMGKADIEANIRAAKLREA